MFSFFRFSYKDLLKDEPNRYDIVRHMRKSGIKQKDFIKFKEDSYLIGEDSLTENRIYSFFLFVNIVINYTVYTDIRNKFDLDFYISDIKKLYKEGSVFVGKQQLEIIIESLNIAYPMMIKFMKNETEKELVRKQTIESAGMVYTKHIYPDYRGSDELFYDMPTFPVYDFDYEKAKRILEKKLINIKNTT